MAAFATPGNIHHPDFGTHLCQEMSAIGNECVFKLDTDYSSINEAYTNIAAWTESQFSSTPTTTTTSTTSTTTTTTSSTTTTLLSYDVWISSDQGGSPFVPFHDCVRFNGSVMSTDVCADSGTVASFPILSISGLELFIGQVPCQGLNLIYIGTAFAGQALPLGGNSIAASIIPAASR